MAKRTDNFRVHAANVYRPYCWVFKNLHDYAAAIGWVRRNIEEGAYWEFHPNVDLHVLILFEEQDAYNFVDHMKFRDADNALADLAILRIAPSEDKF